MFSVKGWAVDSNALKPQIEPFKVTKATTDENIEAAQTKKRKRGNHQPADNADVGKLWERHVEKVQPSKVKKEKKKDRKRQKLEQDESNLREATGSNAQEVKPTRSVKEDTQPDSVAKNEKKKAKKDKKPATADGDVHGSVNVKKDDDRKELADSVPPKPKPSSASKLTPMQAAMRQKLVSARFRHLNQTLYTEPSAKALDLFDQNPDMFEDYHSGFRQQVAVWPENPVDNFIATIRARGSVRLLPQKKAFKDKKKHVSSTADASDAKAGAIVALPRTHGTGIIADLGCGDARLAHTLKSSNDLQNLNLKVFSYDLHSPSSLVTKADISALPTEDGSIDVAIFCLALMGTNWISFIEEAYRILHWKGELWIAEIKSRFGRVGKSGKPVEHSVGGKRKQAAIKKAQEAKKKGEEEVNEQEALAVEVDGVETKNEETDVSAFVDVLRRRGFLLKNGDASVDLGNKMFVKMEFIKAAAPTKGKGAVEQQDGRQAAAKFRSKKFLDENKEDEVATEDEAKVLKPCLYKVR